MLRKTPVHCVYEWPAWWTCVSGSRVLTESSASRSFQHVKERRTLPAVFWNSFPEGTKYEIQIEAQIYGPSPHRTIIESFM